MTETIKTLLQPIQNRLNAATPGPWEMEESRYSIRADTYRIIGIERFRDYTNDISLGEDKATAEFIAAAPTDQARLLAAIDAVERTAQYLDKLADGDRHYANLFRKAVTDALTEAR